jgi:hypothetical protein
MYAWQKYPDFELFKPLKLLKLKKEQACTLEAKICPDGTSVGRLPPNCDFAPCLSVKSSLTPIASPTATTSFQPQVQIPADWKTYKNEKYDYEFSCPQNSIHNIEVTNGDGKTIPYYQEICYEVNNQLRIQVFQNWGKLNIDSDNVNVFDKEFTTPSQKEIIVIRGFDQNYFSQILSTFRFE